MKNKFDTSMTYVSEEGDYRLTINDHKFACVQAIEEGHDKLDPRVVKLANHAEALRLIEEFESEGPLAEDALLLRKHFPMYASKR